MDGQGSNETSGQEFIEQGELLGAARQLLESYHRSGLRWMIRPEGVGIDIASRISVGSEFASGSSPVVTASALPTSIVRSSASATEVTISATTLPVNVLSQEDSKESELARAKKTTAANDSMSSSSVVPAQDFSWKLPVLDLTERESRFEKLKKQVAACKKCPELVAYRTRTVFGDGCLNPKVCFFGEAPGADEDKQGIPFVGRAGQLLDKIIEASQLRRPEDVYILNSLRCRPPNNRTPAPEEVENCRPFFETQFEVLQPKYIVCLGAVAVRAILQTNVSIGSLRGKFHNYRGAKVLVTYHPAYLLRNPDAKKLVWEDMQILMKDMGIKPPKK
jgi:uracil-DNA glycosylase family 4